MALTKLEFGSTLRPSTVSAINKINEIIDTVNGLSGTELSGIQSDVSTLKSNVQTDIDKIKVTLYTPLKSDETTD